MKFHTMRPGMMGFYYAFLRTCHGWLVEQGVESEPASRYVGALMHCVALDGERAAGSGFQHLISEQSKGGYNEQGIAELEAAGVFEEIKATLTSLNARWEGRAVRSELRPVTHSSPRESAAKGETSDGISSTENSAAANPTARYTIGVAAVGVVAGFGLAIGFNRLFGGNSSRPAAVR